MREMIQAAIGNRGSSQSRGFFHAGRAGMLALACALMAATPALGAPVVPPAAEPASATPAQARLSASAPPALRVGDQLLSVLPQAEPGSAASGDAPVCRLSLTDRLLQLAARTVGRVLPFPVLVL